MKRLTAEPLWTLWMAEESFPLARRLPSNLHVKLEEIAVTEEIDLTEETDLKEEEVHHQATSALSAEELATGKNQFKN